jgi:hypothetical protein
VNILYNLGSIVYNCYIQYCFFSEDTWLLSQRMYALTNALAMTQSLILGSVPGAQTWRVGARQVHMDIMIKARAQREPSR